MAYLLYDNVLITIFTIFVKTVFKKTVFQTQNRDRAISILLTIWISGQIPGTQIVFFKQRPETSYFFKTQCAAVYFRTLNMI